MLYSINPKRLSILKGIIGEEVVRSYINEVLSIKLKREGWNKVIYCGNLNRYAFNWHSKTFIENFFLRKGIHPTPALQRKLKELSETLTNVPDGFLFKLRKTSNPPFVDGEIEVIEVKYGKTPRIHPSQKESYKAIIEKGYTLRLFYVRTISIDDNKFEIFEKVIKNINNL